MQKNKDLAYWVALANNPQIGAKTILKLEKVFQSLERLFRPGNLKRLNGLGIAENIRDEIRKIVLNTDPRGEINKLRKLGISPISIRCAKYPQLLSEIPDPPALLFTKGNMGESFDLSLAVVGARKYSSYGRRVVQDIVRTLSQTGIVILSGLALGIDSIAHKTTLETGGRTIGVLANGLDQIYPSSNKALAEDILAKGGALISEYPPGVPPYKYNFPLRNRIIAGMSLGTLIIEAAQKSGTLLTAKAALDYNRELFAIPGNIYSPTSEGANNLIKYGAKLINCAEDILKELNIEAKIGHKKAKKVIPTGKDETKILNHLDTSNPIHIDKLSRVSGIEIADLSSKLIFMEMKGMVKNIGANNYILG